MDEHDDVPLEGVATMALEQVIGTDAVKLQKAHSEAHLQRVRLLNTALAVGIALVILTAPALVWWVWSWALR